MTTKAELLERAEAEGIEGLSEENTVREIKEALGENPDSGYDEPAPETRADQLRAELAAIEAREQAASVPDTNLSDIERIERLETSLTHLLKGATGDAMSALGVQR